MITIILCGMFFTVGFGGTLFLAWIGDHKQLKPAEEPKLLQDGKSNDILVVNLATGEETELPALLPPSLPPKKGGLLSPQLRCPRCNGGSVRVLSGYAWCVCDDFGNKAHAHVYCTTGCGSKWLEEVPNNYDS